MKVTVQLAASDETAAEITVKAADDVHQDGQVRSIRKSNS